MNTIAFNQQLSDKLNKELNPELFSTPGKGEITVVANEKKDLREYRIITKDNKVVDVVDAYDADHDTAYQKMMDFFMKEQRIYAGYDLNGTALNQYQAGSFLAPITYASDKGEGYLKLLQQNKYIFTQDLPLDNYYDATMITMIALEMF